METEIVLYEAPKTRRIQDCKIKAIHSVDLQSAQGDHCIMKVTPRQESIYVFPNFETRCKCN